MSAVPLILCADASNALHIRTLIVEAGGRVPPRLAAGAEWRDVNTWPKDDMTPPTASVRLVT